MEKGVQKMISQIVRYEVYSDHGIKLDEFQRLDQAEAALERWPQASFLIGVDQRGSRSIVMTQEKEDEAAAS